MKFYNFNNPYTALIKASSEEEAKKTYVEFVADDDGDLEFEEIERDHAIVMFSQAKGENKELIPADEILEQLRSDQPELLLIDGSLL